MPLFETVTDLIAAPKVMEELYTNPHYRAHLENRNNKQTIMLGFSDGTKDGGGCTTSPQSPHMFILIVLLFLRRKKDLQ